MGEQIQDQTNYSKQNSLQCWHNAQRSAIHAIYQVNQLYLNLHFGTMPILLLSNRNGLVFY